MDLELDLGLYAFRSARSSARSRVKTVKISLTSCNSLNGPISDDSLVVVCDTYAMRNDLEIECDLEKH